MNSVWKEGVTWAEVDTRASSTWPLESLVHLKTTLA